MISMMATKHKCTFENGTFHLNEHAMGKIMLTNLWFFSMEIDGNRWKWMEIVDLNGFEGYPTLRTNPQRKEMLDRTTTRRQSMFGLSASGL